MASSFTFVDGLSKSYSSTSIRSKVMKHAYQEKNKLLGNGPPESKAPWTRTFELVGQSWVVEESDEAPALPATVAIPDTTGAALVQVTADFSSHASLQPRTILGAGRIDHLSTLPVPRTPIIDQFVASYLGPVNDYALPNKKATGFDYRLARFKAALSDECSFYAMLTWLHRRAVLDGDPETALQSLYFKGQCLRIMGERLHDHHAKGMSIADGTMYGALDLSNAEIRFGEVNVATLHWQGLRRMVMAKKGLVNIVDRIPLIYSLLWNYMALGLEQGVQWDYIPPVCLESDDPSNINDAICDAELEAFMFRLQDQANLDFLNHPTIRSGLASGTIMHLILCISRNCKRGKFIPHPPDYTERSYPQFTGFPRNSTHNDGESLLPEILRASQSPVPAIYVFLVSILLHLKDATETSPECLEPTLTHFFSALDRALFDHDFDRHPCDVESVLMMFIRGFELHNTPCFSADKCLFHEVPTTPFDKFPSWQLTFSIMNIVGGLRKLSTTTRRNIVFRMQELFIHPNSASLKVAFSGVIGHASPGHICPPDDSSDDMRVCELGDVNVDCDLSSRNAETCSARPELYEITEQMRLDLGL